MISGRGLIAKEFQKQSPEYSWGEFHIFASGVSNSSSPDLSSLKKERGEIENLLLAGKKLVYFSTMSILGKKSRETLYCRHKIEIERQVLSHLGRVVRLPLVAGKVGSNPTLLNHFTRLLDANSEVTIHKDAVRNLVDVEHLPALVAKWIEEDPEGSVLPVSSPFDITSFEIAKILRGLRNSESTLVLTEGGEGYPNFFNSVSDLYRNIGMIFDSSYNRQLLGKYFSLAKV